MEITSDNLVDTNSSVTVEEFVTSARRFLGVKYHNQGRDESGIDCGGLLLKLGRDLNITDLEVLGYSNNPDGETFEELLSSVLNEVDNSDVEPGDMLACDYGEGIQHTAIVSEIIEGRVIVIHAKRQHGVCEQYLYGRDLRGWVKTYRLRHLDR